MGETAAPPHYIDRLVKLCKAYVDRLDNGGSDIYIQKTLVMLILETADSTYKKKLFNNWPNYDEDYENAQKVFKPHFPQTLSAEFLTLNFKKNVKILDLACGTGMVADLIKNHGYTNIDGLDEAQTMLDTAQKHQLYKKVYCWSINPDKKSPIPDGTYDVLLCSAAIFPGSIDLDSFREIIRHVKIGGTLVWNIERYFNDGDTYDKIIDDLVAKGIWCEVQPVKKVLVMFDDVFGFIHVMKRLK